MLNIKAISKQPEEFGVKRENDACGLIDTIHGLTCQFRYNNYSLDVLSITFEKRKQG